MFFKKKKSINAFVSGKTIPLSEVKDVVFSTGMVGDGIAIIPKEGLIISPIDGKIELANPEMQHAIGLKTNDSIELIIHVGLDTVNLNNKGFELLVSQGQKVKIGDPLLSFDRNVIASAGFEDVVIMIVTNPKEFQFKFQTNIEVSKGEEIAIWN